MITGQLSAVLLLLVFFTLSARQAYNCPIIRALQGKITVSDSHQIRVRVRVSSRVRVAVRFGSLSLCRSQTSEHGSTENADRKMTDHVDQRATDTTGK